jgi:hypothetical protein
MSIGLSVFRIDSRTIKRGDLNASMIVLLPLGDLTFLEKHVCEMLTPVHNWWNLVELTHLHKGWSGEEKVVTGCDRTLQGPVTPGKSDQWLNIGTAESKWRDQTLALRCNQMDLCHCSRVGNVSGGMTGHWVSPVTTDRTCSVGKNTL